MWHFYSQWCQAQTWLKGETYRLQMKIWFWDVFSSVLKVLGFVDRFWSTQDKWHWDVALDGACRTAQSGGFHDEPWLVWCFAKPQPALHETSRGNRKHASFVVFLPGEDQISNLHEFDLAEGNFVLQWGHANSGGWDLWKRWIESWFGFSSPTGSDGQFHSTYLAVGRG